MSDNNNDSNTPPSPLEDWRSKRAATLDAARSTAAGKRHARGFRTARENLDDLCDADSFVEYGQLAVAAQRSRKTAEELRSSTAADGILTGTASINAEIFGAEAAQAAVVINDYSVLAGTQGYFHHKKLDRILEVARENHLPVVMYTEGGGGRPGDVDVTTVSSGLTVPSFANWSALSGEVPRIAVNNGYCFAGNAALFGCADITIATATSWIGMAGPAMIEGGGLGRFAPTEIGPTDEQSRLGVVDVVVADEASATTMAKKLLGYFQGTTAGFACADQKALATSLPENRRMSYKVREIISRLADTDSFVELRPNYGSGIITAFMRLEGRPVGLLANDCRVLAGAISAAAAEKAARFMQLCDAFDIPLLSLCDTPGFMVGPDSEREGAVRRMSRLFVVGASVQVPWVAVFLRKGYGLGAMAMTGGSLARPSFTAAWPQGEFGPMGLEGAVHLGFRSELEAEPDDAARQQLFESLVEEMYQKGKAVEAESYVELDAVIDPADTRDVIVRAFNAAKGSKRRSKKRFVDVW
ncbi:MAG: biotin carboxylase [Gammaproteobacteria bacterium]|nr:biotin carboxylase [Gammaproteobacteria bacterium]